MWLIASHRCKIPSRFTPNRIRYGSKSTSLTLASHTSFLKQRFYCTIFYHSDLELDDLYEEEIKDIKEEEILLKDKGTIWVGNIFPIVGSFSVPTPQYILEDRQTELIERLLKKYETENKSSYEMEIISEIQRKKEGGSFFNIEVIKTIPRSQISPEVLRKIEKKFHITNKNEIEDKNEPEFPSFDVQSEEYSIVHEENLVTNIDDQSSKNNSANESANLGNTPSDNPKEQKDSIEVSKKESKAKNKASEVIRILQLHKLQKDDTEVNDLLQGYWKKDIISEFIDILIHDFKKNPIYSSRFSFEAIKIFKVSGTPWYFEDLNRRYPTRRLLVSLIPKTPNSPGILDPSIVEDLFRKFRPYGKMNEIILGTYNKDINLRTVTVVYKRISSAIAARSCIHRSLLYSKKAINSEDKNALSPSTALASSNDQNESIRVVINYETLSFSTIISNAITKHSRIFALFMVLIFAIITYTIFDPIRSFSCKSKIKRSMNSFDSVKWFQKKAEEALHYIGLPSKEINQNAPSIDVVQDQEIKMKQYLTRPPGSILYITGAPGTGKSRLIRFALSSQTRNVLHLDFEKILSKSDDEFIKEFASLVGFFPDFTWTEWTGILIDAITPGVGKAASSGGKTAKIMKILDTLTVALQSIYDDGDQTPLLIIEGFTVENKPNQDGFLNYLAKWLDFISHYKLARVVFTGDTSFDLSGGLMEIIPDSRIDRIVLTDASLHHAVEAMEREMGRELSLDMINAVSRLGGRYNDLKSFLNKIQGGQTAESAINEMIDNAVDDIRAVLFNSSYRTRQINMECSNVQLWRVLLKVAETGYVYYDDVLFNIFKGDDKALRSLIRTKIFSVVPVESQSDRIQATSPLLLEAIKKIASDPFVRPGMDLLVARSMIADEQKKIDQYETELNLCTKHELPFNPPISHRISFLFKLMNESQEKIERFDHTRVVCEDALKKVQQNSYH